jgi:hypothetical protein
MHAGSKFEGSRLTLPPDLDLVDARLRSVTVGAPGARKDPFILQAAQIMEVSGVVLAGSFTSIVEPDRVDPNKKALTREELKDVLLQHPPESFGDLLADATLAVFLKTATPFQVSLKVLAAWAKDFMEFRARVGLSIMSYDDGPIYPQGISSSAVDSLRFIHLAADNTLQELTIAQIFGVMPGGDVKLVYKKSVFSWVDRVKAKRSSARPLRAGNAFVRGSRCTSTGRATLTTSACLPRRTRCRCSDALCWVTLSGPSDRKSSCRWKK